MENKEQLPGPVILDVEPISCSMTLTRARDPETLPSSLTMRLRVLEDEVRTPDGRKLNDAEWSMTFYEGGSGNKFTELHDAIGMINYYAEWRSKHDDIDDTAEACHAWANLDSMNFTLLRDMALAGKLPNGLRLHAFGMNYGWEPDGRAKEWDVKAHKNAAISKIEIVTKLVTTPEPARDDSDPFAAPVSEPETPELAATRAAAKALEKVNARLGWVVALLVATTAVVIFR